MKALSLIVVASILFCASATAQTIGGFFSQGLAIEYGTQNKSFSASIGIQGAYLEKRFTLAPGVLQVDLAAAGLARWEQKGMNIYASLPITLNLSEETSFEFVPWGDFFNKRGAFFRVNHYLNEKMGIQAVWNHPVYKTGIGLFANLN